MKRTINSEESKKLGMWLRARREDKGMSMRELAALINKPHSFVGKVEMQTRRLDVVEFIGYCNALELSPPQAMREIEVLLSTNP